MAKGHWQIISREQKGVRYGKVESLPLNAVPRRVMAAARKAAGLIGNGLYGVDLKTVGKRVLVTEVNDNPNLDAGQEDKLLKGELYARIMNHFRGAVEGGKGREKGP